MEISHKSTALTASKEVGRLLRELRKQRKLTGEQLAQRVGVSQSRISKIENGYSESIDIEQLEKILKILEPSKIIRQRLSLLLSQFVTGMDGQFVYPFTDVAAEGNDLQRTSSLFRCYVVCGISAVLQTTQYRAAYLKRIGFSEKEVVLEIGKTIERQEALWDLSKTFYIVMPETALYTAPGDFRTQIAQMDRLERMLGLPNVHIGIIPLQAGSSVFETGTFTFYDDRILHAFIGDRVVYIEDPEALPKFLNAFEELSYLAHFDIEAVPIVRKAADYFAGCQL